MIWGHAPWVFDLPLHITSLFGTLEAFWAEIWGFLMLSINPGSKTGACGLHH